MNIFMTYKDKQKTLYKRVISLRRRATPSEKHLINILEESEIEYIFQKGFIKGNYYCIVDFYIPRPYKLCIEVDGGYHLTDEQQKRDERKDKYLISRRLKILRLKNEQVDMLSIDEFNKMITPYKGWYKPMTVCKPRQYITHSPF